MKPTNIFFGMAMKVIRWDDNLFTTGGYNKTAYRWNKTEHSSFFFKKAGDPKFGWAIPFVTNAKYKIHFGLTGLDYEEMTMTQSEEWKVTDHPIHLVHNWTDIRANIEVRVGGSKGYLVENNTIPANSADYQFGHNIIQNGTSGIDPSTNATLRETHWLVNGKNMSNNTYAERTLHFKGYRCWPVNSCVEEIALNATAEAAPRYWSDTSNWPNNTLPKEGDDVHIEPGWNMIYDLNVSSPVYKLVRVNGNFTFQQDGKDKHFRCKHLFIRNGQLIVGTKADPFRANATIGLYGEKNAETIVYANAVEAGNKNIANVGKLFMYGMPRRSHHTRLT
jgi:hypothetical protein